MLVSDAWTRKIHVRRGWPALASTILVTATLIPAGPASAADETCEGQSVTIVATADDLTLEGTDGPDVISTAGHKGVSVHAGGGDDLVCSPADDTRFPLSRRHIIDAGPGDDLLDIGSRDTVVYPGAGDDTIHVPALGAAREPDVEVHFEDSLPGVVIDVPAGTVDGEGHDVFTGTPWFVGTTGGPDTFIGSSGRDFFSSSASRTNFSNEPTDVVHGYGGDDEFQGFQAKVFAGPGDDHVWGWSNDVHGGTGRDRIHEWQGGQVDAGRGADVVRTAIVLDEPPDIPILPFEIDAGHGDDRVFLTSPDDGQLVPCSGTYCQFDVDGGSGTDVVSMRATAGRARVDLATGKVHSGDAVEHVAHVEGAEGSDNADVLIGNARANHLQGRGGADRLMGRGGPDVLNGGQGHDVADGGAGRDRCVAEVRRGC